MPVNLSTPEININFEKHGQQFEAMNKLSADMRGSSEISHWERLFRSLFPLNEILRH